jgi:hypothetical protein
MQILEHGDPGDPSGACFDAGVDISGGNAAESQDGDSYRTGGFPQLLEPQGFAVDLFGGGGEYGSEHGKIGALLFSPSCFVDSVAGDTNQKPGRRNLSNSRRGDRMGGQMNAVRAGGERNIGAFVDKYLSPTGSRQGDDLASQRQELAAWQIFLPDLDAVDALVDGASNGLQQIVRAAELFSVCDVVPQRHYSNS